MPNRILKDSICTSSEIESLSPEAEVFFYRLIISCDDFGRMDARPQILRAKLYPLKIDRINDDEVFKWLRDTEEAGLTRIYEVDGKPYLELVTWADHQQVRAKRSKYPAPDSNSQQMKSSDINCNQLITNVPVIQSNPIQSESNAVTRASAREETAAAAFQENESGDIFKFYESEIGALTPTVADGIKKWLGEHPLQHIQEAIKEAVNAGVRKPAYINAVLESWKTNGYKSGKPKSRASPAKTRWNDLPTGAELKKAWGVD
ncbi:MAG: DnaD domain-containing protein [Dehalogenimonas sp.]